MRLHRTAAALGLLLPVAAAAQSDVPSPAEAAEAADPSASSPDGATGGDDASSPPAGPRPHTLAELVGAAEASYPSLDAAEAAIEAAEARLAEAHASPFLQFSLDLGAAMTPNAQGTPIYTPGGQLGDLNAWGPAASIQFSGAVPLFTFGKLRAGWDAAEAGVDASEAGRDRAAAQLRLEVRRAYYALTFALDVQQMIREGEGRLERAVTLFEARMEDETEDLDPMDRYRLAAALAEVRARKSQAELVERSARAALRSLTGLEAFEIADCPLEVVASALPEAAALADEGSRRPELDLLEAARRAREAEVSLARGRYFPDLVLAMSATYSTTPGITDIRNPFLADRANNRGFGFGLVARWSLDFLGNVRRVERARAQLRELDAQLAEADRASRLELTVARERLADASRRVHAFQEGERETRQWFVAAAQGYQVGTVEPKALVDALKAYFGARASRLEAALEHNVALAVLERSAGRPLVDTDAWEPHCE